MTAFNIQQALPPADYFKYVLANKPGIVTTAIPVIEEIAKDPIPPNIKIPLLIIGGTIVAGSILYSLATDDIKDLQNKAASQLLPVAQSNSGWTGGMESGHSYWCEADLTRIDGTTFHYSDRNSVSYPASVSSVFYLKEQYGYSYRWAMFAVAGGVTREIYTFGGAPSIAALANCKAENVKFWDYDNPTKDPAANYGPPSWDDLTTAQKEAALKTLQDDYIKDVISRAVPSRIPEGTTFNKPIIFTGEPKHNDETKRIPFIDNNPGTAHTPTVTLDIGGDFPGFNITPGTLYPPTEWHNPPNAGITFPTSDTSSITFIENDNGTINFNEYGDKKPPPITVKIVNPTNDDLHKQLREIIAKLDVLPLAIGITLAPMFAKIPNASEFKDAVKSGVCDTMQPGGCSNNTIKSYSDSLNTSLSNKINGINLANGVGQDAALGLIQQGVNLLNTKVGDLPVGKNIVGLMDGIMNWQGTSRIMEAVTMFGVIHNAMMLSSNVETTLFSIFDDLVYLPELMFNPKAEKVDHKAFAEKWFKSTFISIFGAKVYADVETGFKVLNRINTTGSNVLGNIQQIIGDTQNIQGVTNQWIAELGNALQAEGIVGEQNWSPKPERENAVFKSKLFNKLEGISNGIIAADTALQNINQVTQALVDITTQANQIKTNTDELNKAVSDGKAAADKLFSDGVTAIEKTIEDPEKQYEIFTGDDLY